MPHLRFVRYVAALATVGFGLAAGPALRTALAEGGTAATTAAPSAAGAEAAGPSWNVAGQLEESCSCDGACPCWFNHLPTKGTCSGGTFYFIDQGTYGMTSLDGLSAGVVTQSPKGKTMMESVGDWPFLYIYIDDAATPDQRKALEAIMRASLPPAPAKDIKVRYVAIKRTINGKEHKITYGEYGSFSGHVVQGPFGGPTKIINPPAADPFHKQYTQGETTKQTYNDAMKWEFAGTNYMFNNFTVTRNEVAQFNAQMEEMMKQKSSGKPADMDHDAMGGDKK